MGLDSDPSLEDTEASLVHWMWAEVSSSYVNIGLTVAIMCLIYKIIKQNNSADPPPPPDPLPPPLKKQDMTLADLRKYDGLSEESEGRICVAVNTKSLTFQRENVSTVPVGRTQDSLGETLRAASLRSALSRCRISSMTCWTSSRVNSTRSRSGSCSSVRSTRWWVNF